MVDSFVDLIGCSQPIQQAPMGGIVTPSLVAAVSEAGGLGTAVGSGLGTRQISIMLDRVEALTDRPYAVNFLIPFLEDTEAVRLAARRARVIEMFYGMPDRELVEIIHGAGSLCGWQVGSVEEASAAKAAGCDIITVQGVEGGGHIRGDESLHQLLRRTTADSSVPIVAAGGIGDRRASAAALAAGASAVRVGTRFIATTESRAHHQYIDALIRAAPEDTVVTNSFSQNWPDAPHRVLRHCVEAANRLEGDIAAVLVTKSGKRPVPKWNALPPLADMQGNIEALPHYAGLSVAGVKRPHEAAEVIEELAVGL